MERAEGAYLFDADGKRYIDYVLSWGPMIMGHNHARVRDYRAGCRQHELHPLSRGLP